MPAKPTPEAVLFLDMDGVLNDHTPLASRYCGTNPRCVAALNHVLDEIPSLKIVVSSAWRYMILKEQMTLAGFEMLLLTHGVKCFERIIGHTAADGRIEDEPHHHDEPERWIAAGLKWRRKQIYDWVDQHQPTHWVVVDDLPLDMPELIQTDGRRGLTSWEAAYIVNAFKQMTGA